MRTVGIEEEFLLVDAAGAPVRLAPEAARDGVERELKEEMLETGTEPCLSLTDLQAEVRHQRRVAGAAAETAGARLAALATSPLPVTSSVTPAFRYRQIAAEYGLTRVADVCLRAEDTVLIGALARALVETAARQAADGVPLQPLRQEVLRGAGWRAGRSGLRGPLVHPERLTQVPAAEAVTALLDHVCPVLIEAGEEELVATTWQRLLNRGSGAEEQRLWAADGAAAVVAAAVEATFA